MSTDAEPVPEDHPKWTLWAWAAGALLLLLFTVIGAGMMRGCFSPGTQQAAEDEDEERKKKQDGEKEKKKKDEQKDEVTIRFPVIQPAEPEAPISYAKPGHWATATQTLTANFRDFVGDSHTVITSNRQPFPVNLTPFVLRGSRPVLLTKGRPKASENIIFVPQTDQTISLRVQLEERGLGVPLPYLDTQITTMPSYQYHLIILAKESSRYSFIKTLDSVSVPFGGETDYDDIERTFHYRVVTMDVNKEIPLSENPLTWTSIAYIVWDEADPRLFTPQQERALVDWIHWGGQLIISGPDSIDSLKDSFLAPFLPADNGGARTIAADDESLQQLNQTAGDGGWLVSTALTPGEPLKPVAPWSGIHLDIRDIPSAADVPGTGGRQHALLAERQVGRGRIVISAMQLAERELINWRSGFESFFNGAVLRRPGREYRTGSLGPATVMWKDAKLQDRRLDARLTTNVRFFARDLGVPTAYTRREVRDQFNQFGQQEVINQYQPPAAAGGIGAWNDFSKTAAAARDALREAAGVDVPDSGFVVMCLAVYLVALVPLNWLIFQTIGRVEWAWIAAPFIAIVGTFIVVNQAQLDIGFVRAQTEIGLLEQQPEYARSHLSRYTALYTSLSTTYDLEFENMTSLAAPFPASDDFQMFRGQARQDVDFQSYENVRLAGLPISSNSTGMVHSEQIVALDGAIRKGKSKATNSDQIENHSKLSLRSVCVVHWDGDELQASWFGELLPGKSVPLSFERVNDPSQPVYAEKRAAEARLQTGEQLNLEPMFRLALDPNQIEVGETRLVARVDEVLPGETITPAASQIRGATLVVAHLEYDKLPPPQRDSNTRQDIKAADIEIEDEAMEFE
jgi:hypothetical protein